MKNHASRIVRRAVDGLVALFDGIDNVGTGTHDSNATAWKSLVSAHEIAISGDHVRIDGKVYLGQMPKPSLRILVK